MKKMIYPGLFMVAMFAFGIVNAQYCGSGSGPSVCIPASTLTTPGFENPDSIPCIIQGVQYNESIQFDMFTVFNYSGPQTIDSIEFNVAGGGIGNLPCGLCWATNKSNNRFTAGEYGCIKISGTTNDAPGQYELQLNLKAWINGSSTAFPANAALVKTSGIRLWVRVQAPSGNCTPVDTSSSATSLTASTSCTSGINESQASVYALSITPNPVNTSATLKFNSLQEAAYTLKITDITGKVVSNKEVAVKPGENTMVIDRNGLTAGVYFLSLLNGKNTFTKKFIVID